jgi:hypothetical protein
LTLLDGESFSHTFSYNFCLTEGVSDIQQSWIALISAFEHLFASVALADIRLGWFRKEDVANGEIMLTQFF